MRDLVLDASLALQWFLEDETGRQYGLSVLASLSTKRAVLPILWFYEVGNGLLMGYRRKRITLDQIDGFLTRLKALPIDAAQQVPTEFSNCRRSYKSTVSPTMMRHTWHSPCTSGCLWQRRTPICGGRLPHQASNAYLSSWIEAQNRSPFLSS